MRHRTVSKYTYDRLKLAHPDRIRLLTRARLGPACRCLPASGLDPDGLREALDVRDVVRLRGVPVSGVCWS